MDIKKSVDYYIKKVGSRNPFEIADALNIIVIFEELGSINGYYNKQLRMKQIHINHNLEDNERLFTAAHELGHAILHPDTNTPFLRSYTYFSIDKLENEANKFAIELLIPDVEFQEYAKDFTMEQISRIYGYHESLLALKMK
ncbi:ImmA/IrrE family metallo-endopeptidase [Ihubacter sp. rT4E-8]|uniref:ImmA/IrrE family metallo-endopeptidase n=1 Tax=Ihubacter sp. rT4E-8 TaxID=3242369 RepID=UPI003CF0BAA5